MDEFNIQKRKFYTRPWFSWLIEIFTIFLATPVMLLLMWKYNHYNKGVRIIFTAILPFVFIISLVGFISSNSTPTSTVTDNRGNIQNESTVSKASNTIIKVEKEKSKEIPDIIAELDFKIINNQAVATIKSNIPDGGLFEIMLISDEAKVLNEFVSIKSGIAQKDFTIPKEWGSTHIKCKSTFRYTLPTHPQPQSVTNVYGTKGEKMKGDNVGKNNDDSKMITLDPISIAYPNEESVQKASIDNYKSSCKTMKYGSLARSADTLIGEKVKYKGQVIQVLENGNNVQMRINVTSDEYGFWDDTVYVIFSKSENDTRILEEDIVQFWGEVSGLITYQSIFGEDITIPQVNAKYVSILEGK